MNKKTPTSTLLKKLRIIQSITVYDLNIAYILKADFIKGDIKFLSGAYFNWSWANKNIENDLLVNKNGVWTTYDKCCDIKVSLENKSIIAKITISDGDMVDGFPTKKRFTASFIISNKHLVLFENNINFNFENHCIELEEEERLLQQKLRVKEIEKELLSK